ncbi:hypothetical protein M3Y99_00369700 [Aphelenchoides fujianensis]|nr:hypothetical protein M3Y99_00369700 [Aphelenchoides fujianensis]
MKLACPHQKRLFVYSASFGRTVATQATHCSLRDPVAQDCVDDVLPAVLHSCHAQQSCKLPVDERFLGNPCGPSALSKYLSVISACVHETVFSEAAIKGELESMRLLDDELKDERAFSKPQEEESFSIAKVDSAASFELDGEDEAEDEKPAVQLMSKDGKSTISELRPEVQRGIEVGVSTHNFQSEPIERKSEREETTDEFVAVESILQRNRKQPTNSQRSLLKSSHSVVEQGSLLSNHSPPIYLDAENPFNNYEDCSSPFSHRTSSQHYVRFQQPVVPPRTPLSLHYYS